jgi:hypothetical protein
LCSSSSPFPSVTNTIIVSFPSRRDFLQTVLA